MVKMSLKETHIIQQFLEYDISLVKLIFGVLTVGVFVVGFLINVAEKYLPSQLVNTYKYGKLVDKNAQGALFTLPKRWFWHFYLFGAAWSSIVLWVYFNLYVFGVGPPTWFAGLLNITASRERNTSGTAIASFLGLSIIFIHCCIRLLEVCCISVYSPSRINIAHYGAGMFHYFGAVIAIAAESPSYSDTFSWNELTFADCICIFLFCAASYQQLKTSYILASLRKNRKGVTFTYRHMVPRGGLFEILSSPHITAEIVIYAALTIILKSNMTWWFVFVWVLVNQGEVALLNHWWYKQRFPNYPRIRKAVIPFLL
ncbi:hypothetical protein J437_LFUL009957 [Ladona fulva]|uniref:Polyprenal reductase n=1 Tax=Ladona fulva TaxID=123851 RepID=A0A8K0K9S8_LADFU|nr:hypothetical protein J437_LFUL009957 [Ladona fulva]